MPTQLGKHFFLPFSYVAGVRVDYLSLVVYTTDILSFVLAFMNRKLLVRSIFRHRKLLAFFLILALLNATSSQITVLWLYRALKFIQFLFVFIIFSSAKKYRSTLIWALIAGALFTFSLAVWQFMTKSSVQGIFYLFGERQIALWKPGIAKLSVDGVEFLRPYATFSHPNSMAGFYALVFAFLLSGADHFKKPLIRSVGITLCVSIVILSFSKVASFSLIIVWFFYSLSSKRFRQCLFCTCSYMFVLGAVLLLPFVVTTDQYSLQKRLFLMMQGLEILKENILLGVGLNHSLIRQAQFATPYPFFFLQPIHNIFALFIVEAGVIAGGFLTIVLGHFLYQYRHNTTVVLCALLIFLTGMFDHYWLTLQQNFLLMATVLGLSISVGKRKVPL